MTQNPLLRRALWAFLALVAVCGLVAIPIVFDGDEGASGPGLGPDLRTEDTGPIGGGEAGAGGPSSVPGGPSAPGGRAPGATAATTAAPPPTIKPATGTARDPGRTVPTRAGTYRYQETRAGSTSETQVRVEDKGRTGDEVRQDVVITSQQGELRNEVLWRPDGLLLLRSYSAVIGDCNFEPDSLEFKLPLAAGSRWSSDSSCQATGGAGQGTIRRTVEATVDELRRVDVGGTAVDVWVVTRQVKNAFTGTAGVQRFSGEHQETETVLVSPKYGIVVQESTTGTISDGAGNSQPTGHDRELVSLEPS